jgi:hypothetical protein
MEPFAEGPFHVLQKNSFNSYKIADALLEILTILTGEISSLLNLLNTLLFVTLEVIRSSSFNPFWIMRFAMEKISIWLNGLVIRILRTRGSLKITLLLQFLLKNIGESENENLEIFFRRRGV